MVTVTAMASAARVTIDRLPLCVVALECTFGSEHLPCSAEWTADAAARQAAVKSHVVRRFFNVDASAFGRISSMVRSTSGSALSHDSLTHHMARTASYRRTGGGKAFELNHSGYLCLDYSWPVTSIVVQCFQRGVAWSSRYVCMGLS